MKLLARIFEPSTLIATCLILLTSAALGAPIILFNGSGIPDDAGWTLNSAGAPGIATVTPETGGGIADMLMVSTTEKKIHNYFIDTGATNYVVSMLVQVTSSSFNSFDFGLGLSPFSNDLSGGTGPDRANSLLRYQ